MTKISEDIEDVILKNLDEKVEKNFESADAWMSYVIGEGDIDTNTPVGRVGKLLREKLRRIDGTEKQEEIAEKLEKIHDYFFFDGELSDRISDVFESISKKMDAFADRCESEKKLNGRVNNVIGSILKNVAGFTGKSD